LVVLLLNGAGSLGSSTATSLQVSILMSNQFFVCWARGCASSHRRACGGGHFATYVVAMPITTLWWAWTRPSRSRASAGRSRLDRAALLQSRRVHAFGSTMLFSNGKPLSLNADAHAKKMAAPAAAGMTVYDGQSNTCSKRRGKGRGVHAIVRCFTPIVSDFRPGAWYTESLDLSLLLLLSLLASAACRADDCIFHHFKVVTCVLRPLPCSYACRSLVPFSAIRNCLQHLVQLRIAPQNPKTPELVSEYLI